MEPTFNYYRMIRNFFFALVIMLVAVEVNAQSDSLQDMDLAEARPTTQ